MTTVAPRVVQTHPPAKLNLFLELLGRREDGYHEIDTVMVPIDLCDTLTIRRTNERTIRLRVDWAPSEAVLAQRLGVDVDPDRREALLAIPAGESNLVHRALTRLMERCGAAGGLDVELIKRIPAGAGLGGASSDAAAALLAACRLWGLNPAEPSVSEIAAGIGSDVPFFLGLGGQPLGAARAGGRGERITPIPRSGPLHFVVVFPNQSLSTASVYAGSELAERPLDAEGMITALTRGSAAGVAAAALNRLSEPARRLAPRIDEILAALWQSGLIGCQLTGSGSACFAIAETAEQARAAAERLRGQLEPGALVTAASAVDVPPPLEIG